MTLEEYVIKRVEMLEKENENLKRDNAELKEEASKGKEDLSLLKGVFEKRVIEGSGEYYIATVWSYDRDYERIKEVCGLD